MTAFITLDLDLNVKQAETVGTVTVNIEAIKLYKPSEDGGTLVELMDGREYYLSRTYPYFLQDIVDVLAQTKNN